MNETPAAQTERPVATSAPVSSPLASDQQIAAQSPAEAAAANDMGYAGWVLLGGGLLIVAGGAAFAMSRRPKRREQAMAYDVPVTPVMSQPATMRPSAPEAVMAREPAMPVAAMTRTRPAQMQSQSFRGAGQEDRRAVLEAMVAEAPSEANPFHSRRNRLRRADYLLRTGQAQAESAEQPRVDMDLEVATDRWSEMRFGGKQNSRVSWKPATTR